LWRTLSGSWRTALSARFLKISSAAFKEKAEASMKQLDDRTMARLEMVLDEVCRSLPHGGDHKLRKQVARKLLDSALQGNTSSGVLRDVGLSALADATKQCERGLACASKDKKASA
jgi:hypothetical protein